MGTAHPKEWSWQPFEPGVPSATQDLATSSSIGRQRPKRSGSSSAKIVSACGQELPPTSDSIQLRRLAGTMPPPRRRRHRRKPRSQRRRQTPTNSALPNSGLDSAEPCVRWINVRACPASGSSYAIESASRSDRQPESRTNRTVASPRHRLWRGPPQDARLSPHPLRCGRSDVRKDPFPGAPSRLGPGDFVGLDRPRQIERSWLRVSRELATDRRQKLLPSAVIAPHARKSLLEIEFRQITRQAVSARNLRRKRCSQVKGRLTPMG